MDIIIPPCNRTSHLSWIYLEETKKSRCEECGGEISGTAFACRWCNDWKHISCADKLNRDLPLEIIHPLHLQHRLQLQCDYLDLTCGSSISGQLPKDQEPLRFKDGKKKTKFHYSHSHELGFFKYRRVREKDYDCFWCEKHLLPSEVCYGCTGCQFYLHQVCSDKIPRTLSHSFHPNHPLRLTFTDEKRDCNVCSNRCYTSTPLYVCEMCSFWLDFDCAKLSPCLKLDCHHHLLTFFKDFNQKGEEGQDSYCKACGKHCEGTSVYRCVQCHFSLHLKCVVPSSATHKYHRHPLTMMELIKEDDSEKYYCDVCENERNPKDPVYYCQNCTFIAHIQCVLDQDKVASGKVPSSSRPPMENKALFVEQNEGSNAICTVSLFRPIIHPHQMYEVTEELKGENYCSGCRLVLNGSSYFCKTCPDFYLHEKCAKLSYEIQHPFHSSHPLNLYTSRGHRLIACEECRDICDGFIYFCEQCNFKLDMKCAALTTHKIWVLEEKMTGRVTELHHFTHLHKLVLANCNDPKHKIECNICRLQILGPAYFCPESCTYILHESCLRLPQKIRVPFHPNHMWVSRLLPTRQRCYACTLELLSGDFVYSCEHCDFNLHAICANSLRRPLKCEFHLNDLYYFGRNHISLFDSIRDLTFRINSNCEVCDGSCKGEPFYGCLKCDINFHLKCVRIPDNVKSKYHFHPLLLKDFSIEDDSGKYYCDFCEEERNPNDDIYYCEECNGQTIAHIECVLAEIIHPLHLQHRLQLRWSYWDFLCDKCLYISTGYRYICSCDFRLDLTCASSVSGQLPKDQEPLRFKDGKKKTIFHSSHRHELGFFKYRKVREEDYDCFWCEKHLLPSEVCYGCTGCEFYLHQVCSDKIPRTLSHSFHPKHPLRLAYTDENPNCNVCSKSCESSTPLYVCEMCSFRLDFNCAKLSPSLKLDCHHHLLTFFKDFYGAGQYPYCKACGKIV
ncbi:hypothetical protein J1N35_023553, partial [Gossypium stocksii]